MLTTAALIGALSGYGRGAYAQAVGGACSNSGGSTYQCGGNFAIPQSITADNAAVTVVNPGLIVDTTGGSPGDALAITGAGALSFNDSFSAPSSALTAGAGFNGLSVSSTGDIGGGADGSVTVITNGAVTGGDHGIFVRNSGAGSVAITANGDVTATDSDSHGIDVATGGTGLTVTTAVGSTITGDRRGISAQNGGNGALTVTVNGDVTSTTNNAIVARNSTSNGTDLAVIISAGSTVTGGTLGILTANLGGGAHTVTINGDVTGTTREAIYARNLGTSLTITTGIGSTITGRRRGIDARNQGSGVLSITVNGDVTSTSNDGIRARGGGEPIDIMIGSRGTVTSNTTGSGDFAIDVDDGRGDITVAGTLNGGGGGAIRFDQGQAFDNRLELHPTAVINGLVLAGGSTDTLAFGGSGDGSFDLSDIDTGDNTQQYRNFEIFEVDSGDWSFSGATTQAFTVNGGTLGGTGSFGDLTIGHGAILAPGNSIGTMTVNGAFTLSAGAIYEVEANAAGQSDKVIVKGTVNLTGATLRVLDASGNYKPKTNYTIIDNDGSDKVNGAFATITSTLAFLIPTVIYNGGTGNDVVLTLERNATLFSNVAATPNQRAVAGALDQFPTNNALFLAVLNQTAAGARQAFDALSGEIHATVSGVIADDSRYVRDAIMGRLTQAEHTDNSLGATGPQVASLDSQAMALGYDGVAAQSSPLAFWTRAYGAWGDYDGDRNAASADRDLGGFVSGMDANIGGSWRVGLAAGAAYSSIDVNGRNSSADVDSFNLAGYAGGMAGAFALRGGGAWAWSEIDTSRAVIFPGFYERQKASYDADTGQIFGEVAYPTQMSGISVEPFAGLAYVSVDTDTFRERGGSLASLRGRDTDQDVGYSTLGFRAGTTTRWGGTLVTPHVSIAWQHAFDDVTPGAALAFASTGIGFDVTGVPLAEDSALFDAGLDFALAADMTAGVSYSGQYGDGVQDNAVRGRFTWLF